MHAGSPLPSAPLYYKILNILFVSYIVETSLGTININDSIDTIIKLRLSDQAHPSKDPRI